MSIVVRLNSSCVRRWQLDFVKTLSAEKSTQVVFEAGNACCGSAEILFQLEKLIYFKTGDSPIDILNTPSHQSSHVVSSPEFLVNLAEDANINSDAETTLTPLFDGAPGESALLSALIDDRAPVIEIHSSKAGKVVARSVLALDEAHCVRERFEHIVRHLCRVLLKTLSTPEMMVDPTIVTHPPIDAYRVARYATKSVAAAAIRRAYQLCLFSPHWRTGWRFVDGDGVWESGRLDGERWNSISDDGFHFYADPFPYTYRGQTVVLVEDFDHRDGKGIISSIPFDEHGQTGPAQPVLIEPWHLSYPFVFEYRNDVWMMPESSQSGRISLYRAAPFPSSWKHEVDLISGIDASDASLVHYDGKWWIFATVKDDESGAMDRLSLFYAADLFGPWIAHEANPVLVDASQARQAGRFVCRDGALWRPVQNYAGGYGRALGLAEVTRLSEKDYSQVTRTTLRPGDHWSGRRLHTLNRFGRLECIDGSRNSPRFGAGVLGPWLNSGE